MTNPLYRELALQRPTESNVGGVFLVLAEPWSGFEQAYNRWYDDDHFFSGALAGPWVFAGRRFVATRALRALRFPRNQPDASQWAKGTMLASYFITAGHVDDARTWMLTVQSESLVPAGRGFVERDIVFGGWNDVRAAVVLDPAPMTPEVALDHPYGSVAIEIVEAVTPESRHDLLAWITGTLIPNCADAGQCLVLTPTPPNPTSRDAREASPTRVTLMWFGRHWSEVEWERGFGWHEESIRSSGLGTFLCAMPFVPVVPGTDRHFDEI